jgi:hypothetical protein
MSLLSSRKRALATTASALFVAGATLVMQPSPALAAGETITTVSPTKVAATVANRVIIINGTNFDEDNIGAITIGADPDCVKMVTYVVTSPSQISLKTPGNGTDSATIPGCAVSSGGTPEDITIYATDKTTELVKKTAAVTFLPPPTIGTPSSTLKPVITDNSSVLGVANQVTALNAAGNQTVRIQAGSTFAFDGRTTAGLTGSLGGKPLTTVGFLASDGTTAQGLSTAPAANANFWIAKTGPGLSTTTPTLTITQGTLSKTFSATDGGFTVVSTPLVSALDVTSGKTDAQTTVKITGTGFSTTASENSVTFCGVAVTPTAATATQLTVTTPAVGGASPGLGTGNYSGVCPVVVTRGGVSSPITAASYYSFVDR